MAIRYSSRVLVFNPAKTQILMLSVNPELIGFNRKHVVWTTIGGKREKGETALEAAKREVFEETGLRAEEDLDWMEKPVMVDQQYPVIYKNKRIVATETFFTALLKREGSIHLDQITRQNWTSQELANLRGFRWVLFDEIQKTSSDSDCHCHYLPANITDIWKKAIRYWD